MNTWSYEGILKITSVQRKITATFQSAALSLAEACPVRHHTVKVKEATRNSSAGRGETYLTVKWKLISLKLKELPCNEQWLKLSKWLRTHISLIASGLTILEFLLKLNRLKWSKVLFLPHSSTTSGNSGAKYHRPSVFTRWLSWNSQARWLRNHTSRQVIHELRTISWCWC